MARPLIDNACYHIITRGNNKQRVFLCSEDYMEYLSLLARYKRRYCFKVFGYCLMPNHVHLVAEIEKSRLLSCIMRALQRAYSAYFNSKYGRVGHLWQGRYKSKIITKDRYLIDCISYVEHNPVRANIIPSASEYRWSSYPGRTLDITDSLLDEICL